MLRRHGHALVEETPAPRYANDRLYGAHRFGLDPALVVEYHRGQYYDRILLRTRAAADQVTARVKHGTVEGGLLKGMILGRQVQRPDPDRQEAVFIEVYV